MSQDKNDDSVHINYVITAEKPSGHILGGEDCRDTVEITFHDKALGETLKKLLIEQGFKLWFRRVTRTDVFYNYED